jgi:hypothetical protein
VIVTNFYSRQMGEGSFQIPYSGFC